MAKSTACCTVLKCTAREASQRCHFEETPVSRSHVRKSIYRREVRNTTNRTRRRRPALILPNGTQEQFIGQINKARIRHVHPTPKALLTLESIWLMQYLTLQAPLFMQMPAFVGGNCDQVDYAARAALAALHHRTRPDLYHRSMYFHSSSVAVQSLRTNLAPDDFSLAAIVLLTIAARLGEESWTTQMHHFRGLHAVLAARPCDRQFDGLGDVVVRSVPLFDCVFLDHCLRDVPSAWDNERWLLNNTHEHC
jgi:hypothetical protein